jgi:hypothetical protein
MSKSRRINARGNLTQKIERALRHARRLACHCHNTDFAKKKGA